MKKEELYAAILAWEEEGRRDQRDSYPYMNILREIDFHSSVRFHEYRQFENQDGPFSKRMLRWFENVSTDAERKALLKLLSQILFIDSAQMRCLHRDALRRIIIPWLLGPESLAAHLDVNRPGTIQKAFSGVSLLSITESMKLSEFCQNNDLLITKPIILGEEEGIAREIVKTANLAPSLLVLEDFVGSGRQARKILQVLSESCASQKRILFVPMIMLSSGVDSFARVPIESVTVQEVHCIPEDECVSRERKGHEKREHEAIRAVVISTEASVLKPSGLVDDPPQNAFGYANSGALLVTAHNTPNNTLPMIHHQNALWKALFRRLHHPKRQNVT